MVIGILEIELRIPGIDSLKAKRMQIKRLLARMKNKFNVSAAEIDFQDRKRFAVIAVVQVGNDRRRVNRVLSRVVNFVEGFRDLELMNYNLTMI